ncbi:hypothetical protein EJ08DRAFT_403439 [Tothia fuscella]|uniref:Uncharacterized protein n=1 Tax=Tothia fuscella TaxID=1048955 RepID=A0A9P4NKN0_9PEZI|nr:hypothetical protein EJ08DRAFT_403439 [Tothia fuscella]
MFWVYSEMWRASGWAVHVTGKSSIDSESEMSDDGNTLHLFGEVLDCALPYYVLLDAARKMAATLGCLAKTAKSEDDGYIWVLGIKVQTAYCNRAGVELLVVAYSSAQSQREEDLVQSQPCGWLGMLLHRSGMKCCCGSICPYWEGWVMSGLDKRLDIMGMLVFHALVLLDLPRAAARAAGSLCLHLAE